MSRDFAGKFANFAEYSYLPGAPRQANGSQTQHGDEATIVAYAIRDTRILVD